MPSSELPENGKHASVLAKFFGSSSIIGLPQITKSQSLVRKLLWLAILLTGLTFCAIECYKFMMEFYKYPVVINVEIENKGVLEFPAVTLCNLNSVRKSEFQKTFEGLFNTEKTPRTRTLFIPMRKIITDCDAEEKSRKENDNVDFYNKYFSLNKTIRGVMGHQKENLIIYPTFNTKDLNISDDKDFQLIIKPRYGCCYTFNGRNVWKDVINSTSVRLSRNVGSLSGLSLTLNLELEEYFEKTKTVGARVIVHSPYEFPDTDGEGINILPGIETSIALNKKTTKRLPYPYKDRCKNYRHDSKVKIMNDKDCLLYCLQQVSMEKCNCTDPTLIFTMKRPKCNLADVKKVCCLDKVFDEINEKSFEVCDCPLPCSTTEYQMTTSMSLWPSPEEFQMKFLYRFSQNYSSFQKSFAQVNIYYASLEETIYVQRPVYQNNEWYSHLGGQFGLWLGISLPAIFDCVETIAFLIHHAINKYLRKSSSIEEK